MRFAHKELEVTVKTKDGRDYVQTISRDQLYSSISCGQRPEGGPPGFKWQGRNMILPEKADDEVICPENQAGYCQLLGDICPVMPLTLMEIMSLDDDQRENLNQQGKSFYSKFVLATLSFLDFDQVEVSTANTDIITLLTKLFPDLDEEQLDGARFDLRWTPIQEGEEDFRYGRVIETD